MVKSYLTALLLSLSSLSALEYEPWVTPPALFHTIMEYEVIREPRYVTSVGPNVPGDTIHAVQTALQIGVWPDCDLQIALDFSGVYPGIDFTLAAANFVGRYQWFDDAAGDPLAVTTGIELTVPYTRFTKNTSYYYISNFDVEFSISAGKTLYRPGKRTQDIWAYLGYGFGLTGKPWFNFWTNYTVKLSDKISWSWLANGLFGLGTQPLEQTPIFTGYGDVAYRLVNVVTELEYEIENWGTLSGWVLFNAYARESTQYDYGGGVGFNYPFSL